MPKLQKFGTENLWRCGNCHYHLNEKQKQKLIIQPKLKYHNICQVDVIDWDKAVPKIISDKYKKKGEVK